MNLQDFACKISDLIWGGELGWTLPTDEEGLEKLFENVKYHYERSINIESVAGPNVSKLDCEGISTESVYGKNKELGKMKCSIIIAVLDSYEVTRRQILHFERMYKNNPDLLGEVELIIVDDGSEPSIWDYVKEHTVDMSAAPCFSDALQLHYHEITSSMLPIFIIETKDKTPWSQPRGRNIGAKFCHGEYVLMTDIDHILTLEAVRDTVKYSGDKIVFPRKYAILDENGSLVRDAETLIKYGCTEKNLENQGVHANTFAMKTSIFLEKLKGYDEKFCGKHGGDDVDLNNRYGKLHYQGEVARHIRGSLIYVYPDPSRDVQKVFHHLRHH